MRQQCFLVAKKANAVLVGQRLTTIQQCLLVAKKANAVLLGQWLTAG